LFYAQHKHPHSIYARNTWPDFYRNRLNIAERAGSLRLAKHTIKIIGHLGYLNRTGSSFGLRFLTKSLSEIDKIMADLNYEIHIIGGGEIASGLRQYTNHEHLVWQGYVEDLDHELESSDIFLLLNNAGPYQAAFTRHLVAWSMGLCLIVHANSVKAIPEIAHMENALVVSNSAELAQSIFLATTNADLNRRIREGGRATYEKYFTPQSVAATLSNLAIDLAAYGSHS
jgi:glycosyltransferase involved in cell wall biosynthesis